MNPSLPQITINKVKVTFASYNEILAIVESAVSKSIERQVIGYVNANTLNLSDSDGNLLTALNSQTITYAEGVGIHLAAKYLRYKTDGLSQNYNATDFNHSLLAHADKNKWKLFFVGSHRKSLDQLVSVVRQQYPGIVISGTCDGYEELHDGSILERINNSGADILLVGMGNPKQELWVYEKRPMLKVPVCVMVGAYFDFVSGEMRRAPLVFRTFRLEWFFRLIQEPRRLWKRYIVGIPMFLFIVFRQKKHG